MLTPKKQIQCCDNCRFSTKKKVYTTDTWADLRRITCNKLNRVIYEYLDWHEESIAPDDCPLKKIIIYQ